MRVEDLPDWLESHEFERDNEHDFEDDHFFFNIIESGTGEFDWHLSVELGYANFFVLSICKDACEGEHTVELAALNLSDRQIEAREPNEIFAELFKKGYEALVKAAGRTANLAMTGDV